jgi:uncharacterized iron-regulated protein
MVYEVSLSHQSPRFKHNPEGEEAMIQPVLKIADGMKRCLLAWIYLLILAGCAAPAKQLTVKGMPHYYPVGTIISGESGQPISFETLLTELNSASVIYIGEDHLNPVHHDIQEQIVTSIYRDTPHLVIGMEMFDYRYDSVLDSWVTGDLDREAFIRRTHWYANWRYDFDLYAKIFDTVKRDQIRLVGLNLPFHIPKKIRIGGIDGLLQDDRRYCPSHIDTTNQPHRDYVEGIFRRHTQFLDSIQFDYFYEAQCAWEDTMAESIAGKIGQGPMIVLVGNGHIIKKFGIPDRAFARTKLPFKTLYLASVGEEVELTYGDYIWVTPQIPR